MRPHRVRMKDDTMERLMFLACNSWILTSLHNPGGNPNLQTVLKQDKHTDVGKKP